MAQCQKKTIFNSAKDLHNLLQLDIVKKKSIVTTNGCFDLLHAGHLQYLNEAASLGDILIVGVNGDKVVEKLKGNHRPIQNEGDRVALVAALKMVDYAFIFYEDDPCTFLSILKPNVHVKGGDYSENIIEKPVVESYGGRIAIVSFKNGYSSSSIIKRAGAHSPGYLSS